MTAEIQRAHAGEAMAAVAELAASHDVVLTHGNGPQVGLLALQALSYTDVAPYPLDVLGAESEGMIGYVLEQELRNALPGRDVATLLTQVVVDADDPAFGDPTKPIGPVYTKDEAQRLAEQRGWSIAPDGAGWRRVVASPEPRLVVELGTIALLVDAGVLVVCGGGGGIPVVSGPDGALHGVEAVIDKDLAAERLAEGLAADVLVLLTDVPVVERAHGTADAAPLGATTPAVLRAERFAPGSMAPKVEAACRFVEGCEGRRAAIGALDDAVGLVASETGTQVTAGL
jgi:carbamate kinase